MKYLLTLFFCTVSSFCFCQIQSSKFLRIYISNQNKFIFSKSDFLKEETIKLTSDTFKLVSCIVYFSYCGNKKDNIQPITSTSISNNLKDSSFINLFDKRESPTCITFENIIVKNKAGTFRRQIDGITIKVNQ